MSPQVWCAFLRALALTAQSRRCRVLFATATLPPLAEGLGEGDVIPLAEGDPLVLNRYVLQTNSEPWKADRVAVESKQRFIKAKGVAVILNTVRDAVEVFSRLIVEEKEQPGPGPILVQADWHFLAATMLPGHKAGVIDAIRQRLDAKTPTGVVSTQVLEAGVDLSFPSILCLLAFSFYCTNCWSRQPSR